MISCELAPPFACNFCRLYMTPPPDGFGGHRSDCECECHCSRLAAQIAKWIVTVDFGDVRKTYLDVNRRGESDYLAPAR
ncbi:hypothetical protein AB0395_34860 [Streptosporangium sp. NPDC051023]|uniref:hypothetical protein n=1 Tax=Streptosporangium sp. NPDC051023 TaxID=3155410 RepID=UPI00344EDB02